MCFNCFILSSVSELTENEGRDKVVKGLGIRVKVF